MKKYATYTMDAEALQKLDRLSETTQLKKSAIVSLLVKNADTKTIVSILNKKAASK